MRGDFYHLQVYWYLCDEVEKRAVLYVVTSDIGAIKHKKEVNEIRKNRTEQRKTYHLFFIIVTYLYFVHTHITKIQYTKL